MSKVKALKEITKELSLLYVEDDVNLRKSTSDLFKSLFKVVIAAADGRDGLDGENHLIPYLLLL